MNVKELIATRRLSKQNADLMKIGDILTDYYQSQNRESSFITKKTFAPSGTGQYQGSCPRYWYFAFSGADFQYSNSPLSVAIMANGTDAHARLEKAFEEAGILIDKEKPIELADPPVFGYLDALLNLDGETVVAEFKTTNTEAFQFRKVKQTPSEAHKLQILLYLRATGNKRGVIIYEDRNTLELCVIPVVMTEENEQWLEKVLEWMRQVHQSFKDNKKPKSPFQQRNKICQNCPVYETCWSDSSYDVVIDKMDLKCI